MRENRLYPVRTAAECPEARVQRLHLSEQQVADIVRVTVDDEVDTRTFRAIVTDISEDLLR